VVTVLADMVYAHGSLAPSEIGHMFLSSVTYVFLWYKCPHNQKKSLDERWHSCECGAELDRDTNAAINILGVGRTQRGATCVEAPGF